MRTRRTWSIGSADAGLPAAIVLPPIREALGAVTDVIRDPRRIGRIFGGQLLDRLISALALAATLLVRRASI